LAQYGLGRSKRVVQINRYIALGHTFVIFSSAYLLECGLALLLMLCQRNNEYWLVGAGDSLV